MRCAKWIFALCALWSATAVFAFNPDTPEYVAYETAVRADGCRWVYIVPRPRFFTLSGEVPVSLSLAPKGGGVRATLCADGSWSEWLTVDLTADDFATPRYGATLSAIRLFGGDFDSDGIPDLLLQADDRIRHSLLLAFDTHGAARVLHNFRRALSALDYPSLDSAGLNRSGQVDIFAIAAADGPLPAEGLDNSSARAQSLAASATAAQASAVSFNVGFTGSMDGRFNVDERGAATYELSILAVQGTAGVTPRISLNYSSSDGDGVAGQGWSIGGLSAITRCRQTLVQDNNNSAIGLNADDRFCLDGQRLILVGGVYGANGSTYRTEIDSYAVITAYGYLAGNPLYFTVQRKDGSLSYYGDGSAQGINRSAPPVNATGGVLTWAISRFQDSMGNAIRFQYASNGSVNEHLISRIDYAYGTGTGNSANSNSYLQFDYQPRPDVSSGYAAGARIARTQRLTSIRSVNDGVELRRYNLVYRSPDSGRSQSFVEKIYECVGSACLAPTTFDWQLNRGGFAPEVVLADEAGAKLSTLRVLDINGDGRSDLVYRRLSAPYPLLYRMSNGIGLGAPATLLASTVKSANIDDSNVGIFDLNGDGNQDLLHVAAGTGVYKGTWFLGGAGGFGAGTPYDPGMSRPTAADIDGDGLPDLTGFGLLPVYRLAQRVVVDGLWTTVFGTMQVLMGDLAPACGAIPGAWLTPLGVLVDGTDFNGDGRIDFPAQIDYERGNCSSSVTGVAISQGGGKFSTWAWTAGKALPSGDMNGDGLTDLWYDDEAGNRQLRFSTGTALTASRRVGTTNELEQVMYLDYNGDGYPDLLWPSIFGRLLVQLFNPATESYDAALVTPVLYQAASELFAADRYLPVDIDGDGHVDLLRINHNLAGSRITLYRSGDMRGAGNRIVRIDNGAGQSTAITYKPLTDSSVYTAASDARNASLWPGAPVFDVRAAHYVVASVSATAPTAHAIVPGAVNHVATRGTRYQYGGLKLQSWGRGSLGFAWIKSQDDQTGVQRRTWYRQEFPFTGQPILTIVVSGTGGRMQTITATKNQIVRTGVGGTRYYQVYDSRQEKFDYDPVSGIETAFTRTENGSPDEWGNIPQVTVSHYSAESHTAFLTRTITLNKYGETDYSRRFGRVSNIRITHQRAGEPDLVRTSEFTYNPAGTAYAGLLAVEGVRVDDGAPSRILFYQYDRFGNRIRTAAIVSGEENRYEDTIFDAAGRFPTIRRGDFHNGVSWVAQDIETVLARNPYGQPTRVQHLNGLVVSYGYDFLGREIKRSENTGASLDKRYVQGGISGAQYHVATSAATGAASVEYFDALGRSMAKSELGFDGRWIYSETEYDGVGRVKRQSAPHYSGGTVYWTTNNYDAFRLQSRNEPAAGGAIATTSITYDGLVTTTSNALGQRRAEVRNAAGELVESIDHLGGSVKYGYDAAGRIRLSTINALHKGRWTRASAQSVYDSLGRKTKMVDSDRGTWFYRYNGFDELTDQYRVMTGESYGGTFAQAVAAALPMQRTSMQYDRRGRLISRADYRSGNVLDGTARWQYDKQANGIGQLAQEFVEGGEAGHQYGYDAYGRLVSRLSLNDDYYLEQATYDSVGRVVTQTDAGGPGSGTRNVYNVAGHLQAIEDLATGTVLYRINERDALGNVISAVLGNGSVTSRNYDGGSGHLLEQTTLLGKTALQRLAYRWDALGNPTSRWDGGVIIPFGSKNLQQSFCYDSLNRLLKIHQGTLNGSCALTSVQQDLEYDGFGNIIRKAGIGAFTYDATRPFRLQSTEDGVRYTYDAAGNVSADSGGRALDYTVFDKPAWVRRASQRIDFSYGAGRELRKRIDRNTGNGTITTTHRIGNVEKISRPNGSYVLRRHIAGVAIWSHGFDQNGVQTALEKLYVHADAQGSPVLLSGDTGAPVQQFAYDPWGQRVGVSNPSLSLPSTAFLPVSSQRSTIGFTGHDMLDAVGLIHMRGRVYDPRLGRFLQADPFVQAPGYLQSFNRYAYVFNAPLRFTDPSGFNGAGDDAVTLGSSLGSGVGSGSLLPAVYVTAFGYSNTYSSFDAGNGYGLYNGLVDFSFGNTAAATPKALSVFSVVGGNGRGARPQIEALGSWRNQTRKKSPSLGDAFLSGESVSDDTQMDCHTGVCYVTGSREIYLTGHRVRGVGPFHTALQYDSGSTVEWISAGFDGYTLEGMNRLMSEIGSPSNGLRRSDAPARNTALGRVIPPPGLSSDDYFQRLKDASQNYRNTADYDLFPGVANGYNSNSYISGLLEATGGTATIDLRGFIGGEKPLPAYYFSRQ